MLQNCTWVKVLIYVAPQFFVQLKQEAMGRNWAGLFTESPPRPRLPHSPDSYIIVIGLCCSAPSSAQPAETIQQPRRCCNSSKSVYICGQFVIIRWMCGCLFTASWLWSILNLNLCPQMINSFLNRHHTMELICCVNTSYVSLFDSVSDERCGEMCGQVTAV